MYLKTFLIYYRSKYTLQHTTTHCNTLQHTATHCNTLQHTATHCCQSRVRHFRVRPFDGSQGTSLSQRFVESEQKMHTATHCNILQHTATHCNTLQHTATHCNTRHFRCIKEGDRKRVANTHCNTLQHTATQGISDV